MNRGQLLRSEAQPWEEGHQIVTGALDPIGVGMRMTDDQGALAPMGDLRRRGSEQQRTTGDGVEMLVWLGQACKKLYQLKTSAVVHAIKLIDPGIE